MTKFEKWLTLDLQTFAGEGSDDQGSAADPGQTGGQGDLGDDPGTGAEGGAGNAGSFTDDQIQSFLENEQVQKFFQSETDKVRTAYAQKLKSKEDELEALKVEKMSEAQKKEYEIQKRENQIKEKESVLTRQQIEIAATNALVEKDIPLSYRPFVLGATAEETVEKVEKLQTLWQQSIDAEVQKRFAQNGKTPPRSNQQQSAEISMNDLIRRSARR